MLRAYDSFDNSEAYDDADSSPVKSFLRGPLDGGAWITLLYFPFVALPVGAIAFCWCLCSLALSVVTFIAFPFGKFFCLLCWCRLDASATRFMSVI